MHTRSGRQLGWAVAGALAFLANAPTQSQAQQTGMFPLAPIRRERVPCQMEDPVYRLYRQEYYGYHPTCWRRFPTGWGCPSPEAPNPAASFREIPRDKPPTDMGPEGAPGPEGGEPGGMTPPDRDGAVPPPGPGGNPRPPAANPLPPLPPSDRSPFDLDTRPNPPQASRSRGPAQAPAASAPAVNAPELPGPADAGPEIPSAAAEAPSSRNPQGETPLLALPDPTATNPNPNPAAIVAEPAAAPAAVASGPQPGAVPAQAPRRQGLLSGLFGGLRRR